MGEHESMLIFEKEHKALLILERKFAIQQKLILHLRRLYSCGKLQKLARKERKYSFLLRREGRRLENLVHKLYTVEGKVSHFSKTLRKHHAKWEEGAIQRRRELKRAEMYLKWAHRMIEELSKRCKLFGSVFHSMALSTGFKSKKLPVLDLEKRYNAFPSTSYLLGW